MGDGKRGAASCRQGSFAHPVIDDGGMPEFSAGSIGQRDGAADIAGKKVTAGANAAGAPGQDSATGFRRVAEYPVSLQGDRVCLLAGQEDGSSLEGPVGPEEVAGEDAAGFLQVDGTSLAGAVVGKGVAGGEGAGSCSGMDSSAGAGAVGAELVIAKRRV